MSRLSWNEIKLRAQAFSEDWEGVTCERSESQSFYNAFFNIFGKDRRDVAYYERSLKKLGKRRGVIDLLWPGVLIVEQKSADKDLDKAETQADEYFAALEQHDKPFYRLVSDFKTFRLFNLETGENHEFLLSELSKKIELFAFMLDDDSAFYEEQETVNIKAAELMGGIHDALEESGYKGKKLEVFLTRLTFCLFADSTGIFEPHLFQGLIGSTNIDGSDTGERIAKIFQTLDENPDNGEREANLHTDMQKLPHVNGRLFDKKTDMPIPSFNFALRDLLWKASKNFDWSDISPEIFGSLFQSVMDKQKRREQGAHYTSERDILKVINPLFMDDLRQEFEQIKKGKVTQERNHLLTDFQNKLASKTFFDPACGCGNFLVIAYRELRWLEIEALVLLHTDSNGKLNRDVNINTLSKIDVHQFYGLELIEFAVHIARSALWMMDHFMNLELSRIFKKPLLRIPLKKSPTIRKKDALNIDWAEFLKPKDCDFIFGNPPFIGPSYQSKEQREQMRVLTKPEGKNATPLDYVGAWFLKSATYVRATKKNIPFAFIATSSITQGEQVAMLWEPLLHEHKLDIIFAHQAFVWESEARGKAMVSIVIIGLEKQEDARDNRMLFSYEEPKGNPIGKSVVAISPYLFDATKLGNLANSNLIIHGSNKSITPRPIMTRGPQPTDGGHYIFRGDAITNFLKDEPKAKKFMRDFIGAEELIHNKRRKILDLEHITPDELAKMPFIEKRVDKVKKFRKASKSKETLAMAEFPTQFLSRRIPKKPFLIIPRVSSENREYIPMAYAKPPAIPSDSVIYLEGDNTLCMLSILNSAMHMAWMRTVGGRLESRYRYSNTIVYNTFPLPLDKDLSKLAPYGQAILDARAKHPNTKLANLYRPNMLPNMRKAHLANDRAVDRLYSAKPFADDTARINHLFALYEKQTTQ